jgi:hypothetical protein
MIKKEKTFKQKVFEVIEAILTFVVIMLLVYGCGNDSHTYEAGYEDGYNEALSDYGVE